ncbi:hypothetical protein Tco_0978362 [Tanacetum coccineum]|uniref:Transposase, Ptta/En/Spm, plant n=1 Tax=Tanacetum coccineum TaxID=301880 RepID=A0ABQ5EMU9_9ASTR
MVGPTATSARHEVWGGEELANGRIEEVANDLDDNTNDDDVEEDELEDIASDENDDAELIYEEESNYGRRLSGPSPSHSRANSGQMRLEDHLTDDDGIEGTEISVEVSHVVRGSSIPNQLPAPGDRPMIDLYADEFADQTAIGRAITEILHFRYIEPWPAWGAVPQDKKDQMWLRFKQLYQWDPKKDELVRKCFMKHAANRFNELESFIRTEQKNRNTSVGGVHTCGSRSFTTTRKVIEKVTKGPMGSTKFYTYAHTLKATRPPLVQQSDGLAGVDRSVGEGESNGVGGSDGTDGSIGVCGSNNGSQGASGSNDVSTGDGGSTSIEVDVVEPVWVNDKSREHIEKYKACMTKIHGEDVESHPHNQETWNEVTPVKRGITHGAGTSSDPIFVLTGIPSTPHAATSYPPDAVWIMQISQENGQNRTNTDTGTDRVYKSRENAFKVGLSSRIESSEDEGLGEEDASKQGRIDDIDANEDIYLVNVHRDEYMFRVNDLEGDEVIVETKVNHEVVVETEVASKDVNLSVDEVTLAQALAALKSAKPKADKVMLQEPEQGTITTTTVATTVTTASTRPKAKGLVIHKEEQETTPTVSSQQPSQLNVKDKGKGKMVEPEPVKKLSKKDQLMLDEELAFKLQAEEEEEEEEEGLAKEKA